MGGRDGEEVFGVKRFFPAEDARDFGREVGLERPHVEGSLKRDLQSVGKERGKERTRETGWTVFQSFRVGGQQRAIRPRPKSILAYVADLGTMGTVRNGAPC